MDDFDLSDSYGQYSAQDAVQPNAPAVEAQQQMRARQFAQATGIAPPQQQQAQPIEVPWSQSDSIEKQRLQRGLSQAQSAVESGEINPREGEEHKANIMQALQPLLLREQKAQAQIKQQQTQEVMHATALQEGIEQTHAKARAGGFASTIASYTDPVSGATEHFYQHEPGKWKPIEFGRSEAAKERAASNQGEPGEYFPLGNGPGAAVGDMPTQTSPEMAKWIQDVKPVADALGAEQPSTPTPTPAASSAPAEPTAPVDTRHQMTIINGSHKQVFAFNPNGTVETLSDTRPPGTGVDDSQANALLLRARSEAAQLMGPRTQITGNNPRMVAIQAQRQRTWDTNANYIYRNAVLHQTKQADMEAQWAHRDAYQAQGQQGKEDLLQARGQQSMDLAAHRGATTSKILEDALKHAKALAGDGPITQDAIDKSVKYVRGLHAAHGAILPAGAPEAPGAIPTTAGDLGNQFLQNLQSK